MQLATNNLAKDTVTVGNTFIVWPMHWDCSKKETFAVIISCRYHRAIISLLLRILWCVIRKIYTCTLHN